MAVEVSSINCFMVSKKDNILFFELNSLQLIDQLDISLMQQRAGDREPNEILGMALSKCQRFFAVLCGKNKIMN